MNESDILYERGDFWVANEKTQYTVYRNGNVAAYADSSYSKTADGLSIARARVDYLAGGVLKAPYSYANRIGSDKRIAQIIKDKLR